MIDLNQKISRRSFLKALPVVLAAVLTAPYRKLQEFGAAEKSTDLKGREARYYRRTDTLAG